MAADAAEEDDEVSDAVDDLHRRITRCRSTLRVGGVPSAAETSGAAAQFDIGRLSPSGTPEVLMFRRMLIYVLAVGVLAGGLSAPAAAAEPCRVGEPVVNVTETVMNVVDVGVDGHIWALDDYRSSLRIWRTGPDTYCAIEQAVGVFTTFAGPSPALTGTVREGLTGGFVGTTTFRVTGNFEPRVGTSGYLGRLDADCDREENCARFDYRFTEKYFATIDAFDIEAFNAAYASLHHGYWVQTTTNSSGDIVG